MRACVRTCVCVCVCVWLQFYVYSLASKYVSSPQGEVVFEYQPLFEGESTAALTLSCNELGSFRYELLLKALGAPPEPPLLFQTPLGGSHVGLAKFINYSRSKAEYSCKVRPQALRLAAASPAP